MFWIALLIILLALAAAPWLIEARRRRIDESLRDHAPGRFVDLSQGKTHYIWHGPDRTRTLVLVHDTAEPSWIFAGLTRGLVMSGYRVLAYDLYGRGFSDRPKGAQTLEFHARQLGELIDALAIEEPITLLGYGLGGAIATHFAADQSDRVERLILIAPAGVSGITGPLGQFIRSGMFGTWLWGFAGGLALQRRTATMLNGATVIPDMGKRIHEELGRRGYLAAILSSQRHALAAPLKTAHREIAAMYVPTLAIWGEKDATIPPSAMGDLARWNRQAHQEVVPEAGHGLVHSHPNDVLNAIRTFLRDIPD